MSCSSGVIPAGRRNRLPSWIGSVRRGMWHYSAPYDDVLAFLQRQFATGRRYDDYGATWWNGLPPCYNDAKYDPAGPAHESPPRGWVDPRDWVGDKGPVKGTEWRWSDGATTLDVELIEPRVNDNEGTIFIVFLKPEFANPCNRA
jgi:hypothetical protein